jgi:protein-disulfide isomerase
MPPRDHTRLIIASVIAVVFIIASVWYTQFRKPSSDIELPTDKNKEALLAAIRPIQPTDHVRGNPAAKLVYVVYSDFGCPYCKEFHRTMQMIVDRYGRSGDVAWVFRQMPLVQLHPQANVYALASECVAAHGGNPAFWKFADALFEKKEPNSEVSANELVTLATASGVDAGSFTSCMQSNEGQARVTQDFDEARAAGVEGTPYTVLITSKQRVEFSGARPPAAVASATEAILKMLGITKIEGPSAAGSPGTQFTQELNKAPQTKPEVATTTSVVRTTTATSTSILP